MGNFDKIVNLCKNRGFIFPGSEMYVGLANTWDYGAVGVELKNNIKRSWWKKFVQESHNSFGVDADIFMNSKVWDASGHTASFSDPKMDCKSCKTRHRADSIIEDYCRKHNIDGIAPDAMTREELIEELMKAKIREARLKKGYLVKGVGADKEYILLDSKNTK